MNTKTNKAVINLFKSIVSDKDNALNVSNISILALKSGVMMPAEDKELVDYAISLYGINRELFNSTLHKNWNKVETAPIEQLFAEQMLHYLTTYGTNFESPYVYVPSEELNIPELNIEKIKFTVINTITMDELKDKVKALIGGVALSSDTVNLLVDIWEDLDLSIDDVKNRELLVKLCEKYELVPKDAETLLRVLLSIITGSTLKIKNNSSLTTIKYSPILYKKRAELLLDKYISVYGYKPLAEIFNRNKDLFVSMKGKGGRGSLTLKRLNAMINKISRIAKKVPQKHYKPSEYMQITNTRASVDMNKAIDNMSVFREISLINHIDYLLSNPDDVVYKIRNGKTFVKENNKLVNKELLVARQLALKNDLCERLSEKFRGKTFYIPNSITYGIPTSEKQFLENIPYGTSIEFNKKDTENVILAIAWNDDCDIDASLIGDMGKIGWNSNYRKFSDDGEILFSGDMTSLKNGNACEAHLIKGSCSGRYAINLYSSLGNKEVIPYKFVVAKTDKDVDIKSVKSLSIIDPNSIVTIFNRSIDSNSAQQYVCNVDVTNDKIRLTFVNENAGSSHVSSWSVYDKRKLKVLNDKFEQQMTLNDLIVLLGGKIIETPKYCKKELVDGELKTIYVDADYDLSLEKLSRETILELFS